MQVDQSLVDFELVTIPGFRTLTTGLNNSKDQIYLVFWESIYTHCFTSRNLQYLGGETDWALDTELFVLCPINEIRRN